MGSLNSERRKGEVRTWLWIRRTSNVEIELRLEPKGAFPVNSTGTDLSWIPSWANSSSQKSRFTSLDNAGANLTLSICRILCFLLRRLCFRMSRDEVLCSVELLNLRERRANVTPARLSHLHFLPEGADSCSSRGGKITQTRRWFQLNGSRDQINNLILQSVI